MLNKILVPLDGSALAASVLPHIIALGQEPDTQITLLHVMAPDNSTATAVDPMQWHLRKTEAQAYLDQQAAQLAGCLPVAPETVVLEGRAADHIVEFARRGDYSLVVLSSHGQSGLTVWNIGSVAVKVIAGASTSILLVRAGRTFARLTDGDWSPIIYRRILVPLDGSLRAEYVLPYATMLAQQHNAELVLGHVLGRPEMIQRIPMSAELDMLIEQVLELNRIQAAKYLEQIQGRIGLSSQTRIVAGDNVASALNELAVREECDLVLLTAHGHSGQCQWPHGRLPTSLFVYGTTSLLVLQDVSVQIPEQVDASFAGEATRGPGVRTVNTGRQEEHDQVKLYGSAPS